MTSVFNLYPTYYSLDSFPFEWLQKTQDLKLCCRDTSGKKVAFSMFQELLKALRECERVTAPEKCPPDNWGFAGFMKTAAHQVLKEVHFKANEKDDIFLMPYLALLSPSDISSDFLAHSSTILGWHNDQFLHRH
ncbi:hypothetical protein AJ78_04540 [Emergomyces pasteurianus Ep9510]|uniref:Uncharacterized protein n=1 Tax=Emergomyces pasteurianus Ep9510 TaxID=1447872 RepID=A0A1J9PFE6_9EURO|nr:hypothetical protein AJ78_04540 [Emergomyces pasteurianus Ep9510]